MKAFMLHIHMINGIVHVHVELYTIIIIYNMLKNQPGAVKKGAAKQSRIKNVVWRLRWLVRAGLISVCGQVDW